MQQIDSLERAADLIEEALKIRALQKAATLSGY
jgi:hypothetical protein